MTHLAESPLPLLLLWRPNEVQRHAVVRGNQPREGEQGENLMANPPMDVSGQFLRARAAAMTGSPQPLLRRRAEA